MCSCLGIVALLSFCIMIFLCRISECVETCEAWGSSSACRKHDYAVGPTSHLGESSEELHDRSPPAKRLRGDHDQACIDQNRGLSPSLVQRQAKMHQDYLIIESELQKIEQLLKSPEFLSSVTSETNLYHKMQYHIKGLIGMTNGSGLPWNIRFSQRVLHLKDCLHDIRAHEPTIITLFRKESAWNHSISKLKLTLSMEKIIFMTIDYLHKFQWIGKPELLDFFGDQKTLRQVGSHIHDNYQYHGTNTFRPFIISLTGDSQLFHLHTFLSAFPQVSQLAVIHVILSKTCRAFQNFDHLLLNMVHPKFHEFVNVVAGEKFVQGLMKTETTRSRSEKDSISQGIRQALELFFEEEMHDPIKSRIYFRQKALRIIRQPTWDDKNNQLLRYYMRAVEKTQSLLHIYWLTFIAQLGFKDLEDELCSETRYHNLMPKLKVKYDEIVHEKTDSLLFHRSLGTCLDRVTSWPTWHDNH